MNLVSIIILILVIIAAIFILTFVAHDRGSSMCAGCHGDCENCGSRKKVEEKDGEPNEK